MYFYFCLSCFYFGFIVSCTSDGQTLTIELVVLFFIIIYYWWDCVNTKDGIVLLGASCCGTLRRIKPTQGKRTISSIRLKNEGEKTQMNLKRMNKIPTRNYKCKSIRMKIQFSRYIFYMLSSFAYQRAKKCKWIYLIMKRSNRQFVSFKWKCFYFKWMLCIHVHVYKRFF